MIANFLQFLANTLFWPTTEVHYSQSSFTVIYFLHKVCQHVCKAYSSWAHHLSCDWAFHTMRTQKTIPHPSVHGPGPAPTTAAAYTAASLARLHVAASALRSRHIEFAHAASDTLTQRHAGLSEEAAGHAAAAAQLQALAATVTAQQEGLNVRVQRAVALQKNLSGRAGML